MEPIITKELYENPNYIYEVKWDGLRLITFIENNNVSLINKHQNLRTKQYPDLLNISKQCRAKSIVLDGELIVIKNDKPDFPSIMKRDLTQNREHIDYLQKTLPVQYMLFDILYIDGQELQNKDLATRRNLLEKKVIYTDNVFLSETFENAQTLFKAVVKKELEGIVAKDLNSPYIAGKKHKYWYKLKNNRYQACVIGGYILKGNKLSSLLIGAYQEGNLFF